MRNVTEKDRGVYKCIATNLIGYGYEWTLKVAVRCKNLLNNKVSLSFALRYSLSKTTRFEIKLRQNSCRVEFALSEYNLTLILTCDIFEKFEF